MTIIPEIKKVNKIAGSAFEYGYAASNAGAYIGGKLARYQDLKPAGEPAEPLYYAVVSRDTEFDLSELRLSAELKANPDGYEIKASENFAAIISASPRGVIYGYNSYQRLSENDEKFIGDVSDYPDSAFRAFHMDMRYGFPKFSRLLEIVDELVEAKFNTFLIEYENRFPFKKNSDICDGEHYSPQEIDEFLSYARERHIEIIPLQQTIGHLEYMLKLPQYRHLREVRKFPETKESYSENPVGFKFYNEIDEICASNEEAYEVVEGMLGDVIAAHPDSRYIHIGCDEAWNLVTCEDCVGRFGKDGKNRLYLGHINRMAKIVIESGKIPIVWDDMLRGFSDEELYALDNRIVIMIWLYYKSQKRLASELSKRFKSFGFTVLGAAAAKCGEGPEPQYLDMPWYPLRIGNVEMWSEVCAEEKLDGFCMTVWSNYSGTIAPPHPFFDTVWYPVLFAAEKLWNSNFPSEGFGERFIESFFGVFEIDVFAGRTEERLSKSNTLCEKAVRRQYEAETLRVMLLLSIYRLKALAIGRELYKLELPDRLVTEAEKTIVKNRAAEVLELKKIVKPQIYKIVSTHYSEKDAEIFIRSRFDADEHLYNAYLGKE